MESLVGFCVEKSSCYYPRQMYYIENHQNLRQPQSITKRTGHRVCCGWARRLSEHGIGVAGAGCDGSERDDQT